MPLVTGSGTIYAAPRVIQTNDTRAGCPGTAANGSTLISQTITVTNTATYWTHCRIIFLPSADGTIRSDFYISVDGTNVKSSLDTATNTFGSAVTSWEELDASFMGTLSAGTHTIAMIGTNGTNCWGCTGDWGNMVTFVWEAA